MSHYSMIQTRIVSPDYLIRAIRDAGCKDVEVYDKPVSFRGGKAEIIIKRDSGNDIGFRKNDQGFFDLIVLEEDRPGNLQWLRQVHQRYAYHVATDMLREQDFELVNQCVDDDDSVHLTLRRMI